ncbi:MAG: hypothetical protein KatS3mg103_0494 [Phycisphaerales bacterium]|nr:MAG: hypothetical protein KatS3mg103_0494 [Phycisphaerales bacterium]
MLPTPPDSARTRARPIRWPPRSRCVARRPTPLFQALSAQGGEPDWNYTKYLVDRQGNVVARFGPRVSPSDPQVQQAIDRALAG